MKDWWGIPFEHVPGGQIHLDAQTYMTREGFGKRPHVYPVTIVPARYNGTYEGGLGAAAWLAFPVSVYYLAAQDGMWRGWDDSDVECMEWWDRAAADHWFIGRGETPAAAYDDLIAQLCRAAMVDPASLTREPTFDRDELIAWDNDGG